MNAQRDGSWGQSNGGTGYDWMQKRLQCLQHRGMDGTPWAAAQRRGPGRREGWAEGEDLQSRRWVAGATVLARCDCCWSAAPFHVSARQEQEQEQLNQNHGVGGGEGRTGRAQSRRASTDSERVVISRRAIRCCRPDK